MRDTGLVVHKGVGLLGKMLMRKWYYSFLGKKSLHHSGLVVSVQCKHIYSSWHDQHMIYHTKLLVRKQSFNIMEFWSVMSGIQRAIRNTKPFLGRKIISQGKIKSFIWCDINPFILQTTLQSKKILHSLSNLAVVVKELDNLNEALEHILQRCSWGLDPNFALIVEIGQVLNGAGLGRLQGVSLLKAVAALVQGGLVQVALLVDGLDGAGGANDKVFVGLKLGQLVLSRQGEGERDEGEE